MKVTGYDLRNALTRLNNRKTLLQSQWDSQTFVFEGEEGDPMAVFNQILAIENRIVRVQLAQDAYNLLAVAVIESQDGTEEMPLAQAIKFVGPIRRASKLWRQYAQDGELDLYYGHRRNRARTRNAETEEARRVVSAETCMERHERYQDLELAYGNAIAKANAQIIDVTSLSASDLQLEV